MENFLVFIEKPEIQALSLESKVILYYCLFYRISLEDDKISQVVKNAEKLGISERTFYRKLAEIKAAGITIRVNVEVVQQDF